MVTMRGFSSAPRMTDPRPYHHGSLRDALLQATREVVESRGHDAISMRDLAQGLGVTAAALYRHFANRAELMLAVANEGFAELDRLAQAEIVRHDKPWQALDALLRSYLDFTEQHTRLFLMMYDDEVINAPQAEALLPGLGQTYTTVSTLLARALPKADDKQVRLRMIGLWSTLFGYASVRAHGILKSYMLQSLTREEIEDEVRAAALGRRLKPAS